MKPKRAPKRLRSKEPYPQKGTDPARSAERAEKNRLTEAAKAWKRLGTEPNGWREQLQVLAELVETRKAELLRAYPFVEALAYGFGTKNGRIRREPCVTFIVTAKVKESSRRLPQKDCIPKYLLAFSTIAGKRTLCAVPTDVEERARFDQVRAHAANPAILCQAPGPGGSTILERGAATTAVTVIRADAPPDDTVYLMSCLHLLGMPGSVPADQRSAIQVCNAAGQRIGDLSEFRGFLSLQFGRAFDSALARIDPEAQSAIQALGLPTQRIFSEGDLPLNVTIRTPRGERKARFLRIHHRGAANIPRTVAYRFFPNSQEVQLEHDVLVEVQVTQSKTIGGDSGSPVVDEEGRLIGMHIAGGDSIAFMIPAYELFHPANYSSLGNDDTIVPWPS